MSTASPRTMPASRTRSIAYVGLTVAVMAVSAWVSIPIGPVPFTLQMFALSFAILVLKPKECLAAVACYLLIGAIGLPVFSGMRGGLGVLAGPTGGFLWGYVFGALAAVGILRLARRRGVVAEAAACIAFTAVSYVCGWAQYMLVMGVGPVAALATAVAPFVAVDLVKIAAAIVAARSVRAALGLTRDAGRKG